MSSKQPSFVVLESQTQTTGKRTWAIWGRGEGSSYTELVARVYTQTWAELIVNRLNEPCPEP